MPALTTSKKKVSYLWMSRLVQLILFSFYCQISTAQEYVNRYQARNWQDRDGISLGYKNNMIQDQNGFLWITSPLGINKFDGGKFLIYNPESFPPSKQNSSYSFSIVEDSLHNLWIGTNKGMLFHDTKTDTFGNIIPTANTHLDITTIIPFGGNKTNIFCIESATSIVSYDIKTFKRQKITEIPDSLTRKNNLSIQSSLLDASGNMIWILKGEKSLKSGLIGINISSGEMTSILWPCFQGIPNHDHSNTGMCLDAKRGIIWLNSPDGLISFDLTSRKISLACDLVKTLSEPTYSNSTGINVDKSGNLWFSSNSHGIMIYKPGQQSFEPLFTDHNLQIETAAFNTSFYFAKDDIVWLGYGRKKGLTQLIRIEPAVNTISDPRIQDQIFQIARGTYGSIILGTNSGSYVFNQATRSLVPFNSLYHSKIPDNAVVLDQSPGGNKIWFLQQGESLYETDISTGAINAVQFPENDENTTNFVIPNLTFKLKDDLLVFADNHGLYQLTHGMGQAKKIINVPYHVTNLYVTDHNYAFFRLHFTARNLCYRLVENKWVRTFTPIDSLNWSCIKYDMQSETFWVGSFSHLTQFDKNFKILKNISFKNLGIADILTIEIDKQSHIWINSSKGLILRVDPATEKITQINQSDGYINTEFFWQTPHINPDNGTLFLAGSSGLIMIEPGKISSFPPPKAYIRAIRVNQELYQQVENTADIQEIHLNHQQKNIIFETGILHFFDQEFSKLRYKLKGINDNWQTIPSGQTIQYNELPPGKYEFIIQASESGNNFNGAIKTITIIVSPAFTQTFLFWMIMIAILSIFLYIIIRHSVQEKFRRKLDISRKEFELTEMKQKTIELEQKTLDLEMKTLRSQMNPHFIFNSLNSVNRFILQNNTASASAYLTKFSKLIRMILQHSQEQLISLESELEALKLYLELESIRFENRFIFKVSVQSSIDPSEVRVPPLIIQPYAENSIWHGLMHKETQGSLDIEISIEGDHLYFCITDDGVGRKMAANLEMKNTNQFKSLGMKITNERIMSLGQSITDSSVKISDLTHADGSAAGTEVTIKIPLIYD
jgi:sensor histidine kinase YesM/ligand-binding sensor domain-containing protein